MSACMAPRRTYYEPDYSTHESGEDISLDRLAEQAQEVLDGASAGARPKALIGLDLAAYYPWRP